MCFVYVFALEECARVVAYWRSLLIGPHYRSDKRWHDTQVIRARHFFAMLRSRLMSIVMIVCVEHEHACVRARASCDDVPCSGNVLTFKIGKHCGGRLSSTFEASLSYASRCFDERAPTVHPRGPMR